MAKRFHSQFVSDRNVTYNIEIWDTAFAGTSTEFRVAGSNFQLKMNGEGGQILNYINSTECTFDMYIQDATHEAIITDIVNSGEGQFTIKISKGAVSPTPYWYGQVVADIGSYEEEYYPYKFTIRATDGMALLKTIDFKDTSAAYNGRERALFMMKNALKKLPYVTVHYGSSDNFISTVLDIWETTMDSGGTDPCMLFQQYLDYSVWQKYDKGVEKYTSCYDVLLNILTVAGARLTQRNGVFWVEQIFYRTAAPVIVRTYTRDGGLASASNYSTLTDVDQSVNAALLNGANYEFFPALRKATHIYEINTRRNFLESVTDMNESSSLYTIYKPIDKNGDKTTLRFTGTLGISLNSEVPDPSFLTPFQPFALIFRVNLSIGSANLIRDYNLLPSYQVTYDPMEWGATPGMYIAVPITNSAFLINTSDNIFTFTQDVDIMTPILTDSAENFSISLQLVSVEKFAGGTYSLTDFTVTFELTKPWLEAYSYGSPALTEDEREYFTENDVFTTNSATIEQSAMIGTSQDPNSLGALWVKPASDYVLATNWGIGVDAPDRPIEYFLTELLVSGQYVPTRKINGTLFGSIDQLARVAWQTQYWLLLGGTWNADRDELSGEWVELKYDQDFNASPPIKRKKFLVSATNPPTLPASGQGGPVYDLIAKPPATLIYSVALTTTDDALLSGAITSLPISETMVANDVLDGDTVVIVNPLTGDFEELTVTATAVGGETAIAVSGALTVNYPANSPIVRRPRLGRFFLPEGTTGDILYHNGTAWVVRHIGTSGQILTVSGGVPVWGSAGSGTVTSVALSMPTAIFDVAGSPITGSGTFTVTLDNQTANTFFAGPTTGAATTPAFRAIVIDDFTANLITFAKIQQIATARFLGRVTAGTGDIETLTAAQMQTALGYIDGVLTAARIPYASDTNTLTDNAGLTFNGTNMAVGTAAYDLSLNINGSGLSINNGTAASYGSGAKFRNDTNAHYSIGMKGSAFVIAETSSATTLWPTPTDRVLINSSGVTLSSLTGTGSRLITASAAGLLQPFAFGTSLQYLRMNSGATALEWATLSAGNITGTMTATRLQFAASATALDDDANLTWDDTNKRLLIGTGATAAFLNVFSGAITGTTEFLRMSGNINGNMIAYLINANNASTGANAFLGVSVGGASAGDPFLQYIVSGVRTWSEGVDNSDSDSFKISADSSLGASSTTDMLIIGTDGRASIGGTALLAAVNLTVAGTGGIRFPSGTTAQRPAVVTPIMRYNSTIGGWETQDAAGTWKRVSTTSTPTTLMGTGAGTGATGSVSGTDMSGDITITTGTTPTANSNVITITYGNAFGSSVIPSLTARNAAAATDVTKFFIFSAGPNSFVIRANGTLSASTQYVLGFQVVNA